MWLVPGRVVGSVRRFALLFVCAFGISVTYFVFALPSVSFEPPTLNDSATTGFNWVFVNLTSSEPLNQSLLEWGNQSGYFNFSMLNSSQTNWFLNVSNLTDGAYNYTVWAQNATDDWNQTSRRFVAVDTIAPNITAWSTNGTNASSTADIMFLVGTGEQVLFNVSVSDTSTLTYQWLVNKVEQSQNFNNFTFVVPSCDHTSDISSCIWEIHLTVNDSASSEAHKEWVVSNLTMMDAPAIFEYFTDGKFNGVRDADPWGRPMPNWTYTTGNAGDLQLAGASVRNDAQIRYGTYKLYYMFPKGGAYLGQGGTGSDVQLTLYDNYSNRRYDLLRRSDDHFWFDEWYDNQRRVLMNTGGTYGSNTAVGLDNATWHTIKLIRKEDGRNFIYVDDVLYPRSRSIRNALEVNQIFLSALSNLEDTAHIDGFTVFNGTYLFPLRNTTYANETIYLSNGFGADGPITLEYLNSSIQNESIFFYNGSERTAHTYQNFYFNRGSSLKLDNQTLVFHLSSEGGLNFTGSDFELSVVNSTLTTNSSYGLYGSISNVVVNLSSAKFERITYANFIGWQGIVGSIQDTSFNSAILWQRYDILTDYLRMRNITYYGTLNSRASLVWRDVNATGIYSKFGYTVDLINVAGPFSSPSTSYFRRAYYLDVFVKDEYGTPLSGVAVRAINEQDDLNYPSLNTEEESISDTCDASQDSCTVVVARTMIRGNMLLYAPTGVGGHTPLPSNYSHSLVITDYNMTFPSEDSANYTYSIMAYNKSAGWDNTSIYATAGYDSLTIDSSGAITDYGDTYGMVAGVDPNETWYRPDPNTPTITINLTINKSRSQTSWHVQPANGVLTLSSVTNYSARISSSNSTTSAWLNNTLPAFATRKVSLLRDGVFWANLTANGSGFVSVLYVGGFSLHEFNWTESSGNVSGYVFDSVDSPIANATTYLWYTNGSDVASVNTSEDGSYSYANVNANYNYTLIAIKIGYAQNTSANFSIIVNGTQWVNLTLGSNGSSLIIYLNDTFDRADSAEIGQNWMGYVSEHNITNNSLKRNGVATYANILVNSTLMSVNETGYVVELVGSRPIPLIYFQNMSVGNGYGYYILIRDNDGTNAVQLWKQTGASQSLIIGYQVSANSWATANKIRVVAAPNEAKFNIFKDGIYDGYLEDVSNAYTKGYCGIGQKAAGSVEAESFVCFKPQGTYFDDSKGQGYISNGEYNLTDGVVYNNLTILRTGTLTIVNANVQLNTSSGNSTALKAYGGTLIMDNATISPTYNSNDGVNWAQLYLTTTTSTYLGYYPKYWINNSRFESMGKLNASNAEHGPSAFVLYFSESGSYITNSVLNNSAEVILSYSVRPVTLDNNTFQNPRLYNTQFIFSAQESNVTFTNNKLLANYTERNANVGIYLSSFNDWDISHNYAEGVWDYAFDFIAGDAHRITVSDNVLNNSQKGIVVNLPMYDSVIKNNVITMDICSGMNSNLGGLSSGDNITYFNNTVTSPNNCADGFMRAYVGSNFKIIGAYNYNLTSGGPAGLSGQHAYGAFLVTNASRGVIQDVYLHTNFSQTASGLLLESIADTINQDITITNLTTVLNKFVYGLHIYSCENCTFRDIDVSGSTSDIRLEANVTEVLFINNKNANVGFAGSLAKILSYVYADVLTKDSNNQLLANITVAVSNGVNTSYPSINRHSENKTSFATTAGGHTPLPIGNDSETVVLMDYWKSNATQQNMTYTLSAYDPNNIWTNITHTIHPNGTIEQLQPLAQVSGINPDASWYRQAPNTYQNTTTLQINYTRTNLTVNANQNATNLTVTKWNTSLPQGQILVNFTAESVNGNNVNFTVCSLNASTNYAIKNDGATVATKTADSSGCIWFNNSVWTSHVFTVEAQDMPPDTISGLSNQSQGDSWIYWNWTNPTDPDFNHSEVWLSGYFAGNTSNNWWNATPLAQNVTYQLQIRTVDNAGNVDATWANSSAKTTGAGYVNGTIPNPYGATTITSNTTWKNQHLVHAGDIFIRGSGTHLVIDHTNVLFDNALAGYGFAVAAPSPGWGGALDIRNNSFIGVLNNSGDGNYNDTGQWTFINVDWQGSLSVSDSTLERFRPFSSNPIIRNQYRGISIYNPLTDIYFYNVTFRKFGCGAFYALEVHTNISFKNSIFDPQNIVDGVKGTCTNTENYPTIQIGTNYATSHFIIENNYFINTSHGVQSNGAQNIHIYNNTLVNPVVGYTFHTGTSNSYAGYNVVQYTQPQYTYGMNGCNTGCQNILMEYDATYGGPLSEAGLTHVNAGGNNVTIRNMQGYDIKYGWGGTGNGGSTNTFFNIYNMRMTGGTKIYAGSIIATVSNSLIHDNYFYNYSGVGSLCIESAIKYQAIPINNTFTNNTCDDLEIGIQVSGTNSTLFRDTFLNTRIWDLRMLGNNNEVKFINNNINVSKVYFSGADDPLYNYYYSDILVQDRYNNPIAGAMITTTNQVNSSYVSIDRTGASKTVFATGADGHTPMPIGNDSETVVLMAFWKTSSSQQNMSYSISAYDPNNIWTNVTHTIYPNGTISQLQPLVQVSGVNLDESWYRPDPNVPTYTVNLTISYTRTNLTVNANQNATNITVSKWNTSLPVGQLLVNFTAESVDGNKVTFYVCSLVAGGNYTVRRDGAFFYGASAGADGCVSFNNSVWTAHTFTLEDFVRIKNLDTLQNFSSIQAAIDDLSTLAGHTLEVGAGVFTENINISKPLNILSASGFASTTINASNTSLPVVTIGANGVNLSGFTLIGSNVSGVYIAGYNSSTISGNTITNNWNGIVFDRSNGNILENNTISGNLLFYDIESFEGGLGNWTNDTNGGAGVGSSWVNRSNVSAFDGNYSVNITINQVSMRRAWIERKYSLPNYSGDFVFRASFWVYTPAGSSTPRYVSTNFNRFYVSQNFSNPSTIVPIRYYAADGYEDYLWETISSADDTGWYEFSDYRIISNISEPWVAVGVWPWQSGYSTALVDKIVVEAYSQSGTGIIVLSSRDNRLVNNVIKYTFGYGILLNSSNYTNVRNNTVELNGLTGIYATSSSIYNNLSGNIVSKSGFHGISSEGSNTRIENNTVEWNRGIGIEAGYVGSGVNATVIGNILSANAGALSSNGEGDYRYAGISLGAYSSASGNYLYKHPTAFGPAGYVNIANNRAYRIQSTGVNFEYRQTNANVTNNVFTCANSVGWGMRLKMAAYLRVVNNTFQNCSIGIMSTIYHSVSSEFNLIENNTFRWSGTGIGFEPMQSNIVRNNDFYGLSTAISVEGQASDWASFRYNTRNSGYNYEYFLPGIWNAFIYGYNVSGYSLLWSFDTGASVRSTPAISGYTTYLVSNGTLFALAENTGRLLWRFDTNEYTPASIAGIGEAQFHSSPAFYGGKIFFGVNNSLYAVNLSGSLLWRFDTGGAVVSSPQPYNNTVYVGSADGYLYALDLSGAQKWNVSIGAVVATPLIVPNITGNSRDGIVARAFNGSILAVYDNGTVAWSSTTMGGWSSPVNGWDYLFVGTAANLTSGNSSVYAFSKSNGSVVWNRTNIEGNISATPAVTDYNMLYILTDRGKMYRLSTTTGNTGASLSFSSPLLASPVATSAYLFFADRSGTLYRDYYSLQFASSRWNYSLGSNVTSSIALGNGKIFVGAEDGKVYVFALPYNITISNNYISNSSKGITAYYTPLNVFGNSFDNVSTGVEFTRGGYSQGRTGVIENNSLGLSGGVSAGNGSYLVFLNTTFNKSAVSIKDSYSEIAVRWYVRIRAVDSIGSPLENATVGIANSYGATVFSAQTNASGYTMAELVEYTQNSFNKTSYTPHEISVSKPPFSDATTTISIDSSKDLIFALQQAGTSPPSNPPPGGGAQPALVSTGTRSVIVNAPLVRVVVALRSELSNPSLAVAIPAFVPLPAQSGLVYHYLNITKINFNNSDIANASIEFKVNKSWLDTNAVGSIYLARYSSGWTKLRTELVNSTSTHNTYRAYTSGFSYFAIVGELVVVQPVLEQTNASEPPESTQTNENTLPTESEPSLNSDIKADSEPFKALAIPVDKSGLFTVLLVLLALMLGGYAYDTRVPRKD